jgi:hypothetical protein
LRSYDRIAFTQQIIDQEHKSGIDTVKADIALDLNLNGIDRVKGEQVTVSALPNGDALDTVAHQADRSKDHKLGQLGDMFSWNDKTDMNSKYQKLNQTLSNFESAVVPSGVTDTVAENAMMTGQNVYDQKWGGNSQDAVKNFVTEELYIHTKVCLHFLGSVNWDSL